jgi:hypothetical protein
MATEGGKNVRYVVFARLSDGLALAHFKKHANAATIETANKVLTSGNLKAKSQLTVTIDHNIGTLHLAAGEDDVIAVITAPNYPRRSAFRLLDEIRSQVDDVVPAGGVAGAQRAMEYQSALPFVRDAALKYEELAEVDKITAVGNQVNEVKAVMEGNINKMLDNAETVGAVEDKAAGLRAGAQQFNRRSEQIKKMMWWRLAKLKMIFALLVIAVLGYIFAPIIAAEMESEDDDSSSSSSGDSSSRRRLLSVVAKALLSPSAR